MNNYNDNYDTLSKDNVSSSPSSGKTGASFSTTVNRFTLNLYLLAFEESSY